VNVDETTYLFSPKVLDRANTMEFRVRTEDLRDEYTKPTPVRPGDADLVAGFLAISRDDSWHHEHPTPDAAALLGHLRTLHALLAVDRFEFGHRVIYEALRFGAMLHAAGTMEQEVALDLQVLQKILPRLHGSRRRLEALLRSLAKFCLDLGARTEQSARYEPDAEKGTPKLPLSFDKTQRMLTALRVNQFTSYTE
jgi:5-methylcytosine-specific restriction protein B